ncbi:hypothetical protein CerSpe_014730 [Prunus speciosa]
MDCNKEEAIRAKGIAEKKMQSKDFVAARKIAIKAQQLYPDLENISQMLMVCEVHCSAEQKLFGSEMDWYGILQIDQTANELTIKKQYRKFALQLHPDKNKFAGAEAAFKLIGEAQRVLLDRDKRSMHDLKRKASVSKTTMPYRPPQKASWNSNVGAQNKFRGNFSNINPQNQQQQQPFPPGYSDSRSTFWTVCPFCSVKYQYYREVLNRSLRCQSCNKPFVAYDTNVPGAPPPTNLSQQAFPQQKDGTNKSEVRFPGNSGADNSKAESFRKTGQKAGSSSGVHLVRVTRKRRGVIESSESSDSESSSESEEDMVIDDAVLQAGLKSGIYGEQQPRRSSRHKQQVSYKENLSDDDGIPPSKREKRSGSSCATEEEDEDASKEEASKMSNQSDCAAGIKGDEERVKQKESACFEECLTKSVGETKKFEAKERVKVFDCEKNSEAHENSPLDKSSQEEQEADPFFSFPDSEFNDFEKIRKEECFEVGQVWAIYDTRNGMPRYYARIKKVHLPGFKVQITWLEPDPEDDNEMKWAEAGLPFSCGKFRQGHSETRKDHLMFSHTMSWEKIKSFYQIYPRKGETWAIFKNWSINWYSDLDSNPKPKFEYEFVKILSDYAEGVGIWVALLEKVKDTVSVFCQILNDGKGILKVPPGELLRFSHRVPSFMLTGDEGVGVPSGSFELDPASLPFDNEEVPVSKDLKMEASTHPNGFSTSPDTVNEDSNAPKVSSSEGIEIPEAEFYNFDADKSLATFQIGEIWALYSDEDGLPKYYGQVKNIDSRRLKLHIAWLDSNSLPDNVIRWHDEGIPICCGRFRVKRNPLQDYDSFMSFSHRVKALPVSKNEFEIFPRKGEVWALYKNWAADISCSDLETCEYDIVAVHAENDLQREVLVLERVDGYNSVFKTRVKGRSPEMMTIPEVELLRFSHSIPSFQLTEEKGGSLRGCWELDPAALPVRFFS